MSASTHKVGRAPTGSTSTLANFATASNATAVDVPKQEVRSRVAGSGTAGRGTGVCAAMPTKPRRTRWSKHRAIRAGTVADRSPACILSGTEPSAVWCATLGSQGRSMRLTQPRTHHGADYVRIGALRWITSTRMSARADFLILAHQLRIYQCCQPAEVPVAAT